jgi:RsiW-degrading membrane proteinase PrsW (M82 family)
MLYQAIMNFIIVAGAEEGFKFLVLKKITWKNRNFDYRFDGVIYAVAVSLGFAALENIMYVAEGGLSVALPRALLAIPGHCIFGIFMGNYYGMAKQFSMYGEGREKKYLILAVLHPMLMHGFYDFCLSTGSDIFGIIFFIYVIVLDIFAFRSIKKMASGDIRL